MENFEQYVFLPLVSAQIQMIPSQRSKIVRADLCLLSDFQLIPDPPKNFLLTFSSLLNSYVYMTNYVTKEYFA